MKALIIADLHLSAKKRDDYRFQAMAIVAELLEKHKVDHLIVLGDLTEEKDYHSAALVNDIVDIFYSFSQFCEVIVLKGNHDYTQTDTPFFRFLRRLKRVRWLNSVTRLQLGDADCLFLPHTRDYKKDWVKLPHLEEIDWVFAHNTFEGSMTEHGKRLSGIPIDALDGTDLVISGDIHTPQDVGPVTYVGAPYTVDFGDSYSPRALLISGGWNIKSEQNTRKIVSVPLPGPQKRLVEITTGDIGRLDQFTDLQEGDIVKARVTLLPKEKAHWFAIRDKVKAELVELGAVVHLVQPVITDKSKDRVVIERVEAKSDERVVQEYAKATNVPKATLEAGLTFLREA